MKLKFSIKTKFETDVSEAVPEEDSQSGWHQLASTAGTRAFFKKSTEKQYR